MGLRDKATDRYRKWEANQDAAVAAQTDRNAAETEARRSAAEQEATRERAQGHERERIRAEFAASCPLPLAPDPAGGLPSGVKLQPDEFLVVVGRDWGWSSQRLLLTTHRVIQTHGRASKSASSIYLTDVRDVRYHKPMLGAATITLEASSGAGSLEGLPAARNGGQLRDQLTALVHWARVRQQSPGPVAPGMYPGDDALATIQRLAGLRDAGALTSEEFETKKRELLDRL
jgi:Short C-terminal domain